MRIAWACPLDRRSAIGRDSLRVCAELARNGHVVHVVATDLHPNTEPLKSDLAVFYWRDLAADWLINHADVLIVAIGDNYSFHSGLFGLVGKIPTIGVFHDFFLYNLFSGWLWNEGLTPDDVRGALHDDIICEIYGSHLAKPALEARAGRLELAEIASAFPMTEWIGGLCDGALCHSSFYLDRISSACPGPISEAAMPVAGRGIAPLDRVDQQKVRALTVGFMNPNKCVDAVIRAIGGSPALSDHLEYHLAGAIEPSEAERLRFLAKDLNYKGLKILGAVTDEQLNQELEDADIICGLRRPVLEGASGSAVEALLAGRPLIVADAGFYADLPDDLVFKVSRAVTPDEIRDQLLKLADDPLMRIKVGAEARAWAERRFRLDHYVAALEELIGNTIESVATTKMASRLARDLADFGISADDPSVEAIAAVLSGLFGGKHSVGLASA